MIGMKIKQKEQYQQEHLFKADWLSFKSEPKQLFVISFRYGILWRCKTVQLITVFNCEKKKRFDEPKPFQRKTIRCSFQHWQCTTGNLSHWQFYSLREHWTNLYFHRWIRFFLLLLNIIPLPPFTQCLLAYLRVKW